MKIKTIKDVDEETWKTLKEMAGKRRLKMGTLLKKLLWDIKRDHPILGTKYCTQNLFSQGGRGFSCEKR